MALIPGGDGGYSSFGLVCQASGGKGGGAADPAHSFVTSLGGAGGIGGTRVAGGGGRGGGSPPGSVDGRSIIVVSAGVWNGIIGSGGGGNFGGLYEIGVVDFGAGRGARGAVNAADMSVFVEGIPPSAFIGRTLIGGGGGGARTQPLDGLVTPHGTALDVISAKGFVVVRLT